MSAAAEASWTAYIAALSGDFAPIEGALPRLRRSRSAEDRAWASALAAARWLALPDAEAEPTPEAVAGVLAGPETELAVALACASGELASLIAFDARALGAWISVHERAATTAPARLGLDLARGMQRLMHGELDGLYETMRELEATSARERLAHLVIDAAAIAAMGALASGETDLALGVARRASRMARTESLPQHEYLAHAVLARLRRHTGSPHLATRILAALARVAPAEWQGWLRWELLLAGGEPEHRSPAHGIGRAADAATSLERLLAACATGDRAGLESAHRAVRVACSGWPAVAKEVDALVVAIDPRAPAAGDLFLRGEIDTFPPALLGPATLGPRDSAAYVAAWPEKEATGALPRGVSRWKHRRVLPLGVSLLGGSRALGGAGTRPGRTEQAVAVLVLAGPNGLDNATLFKAVYGFAFHPVLHRSVLDVLVHRVRAQLGDAAEVHHHGERVWLDLKAAVHVPDPRCERPVDDRLLHLIATRGAGTARETAEALGLPLRTVQTALKQLVDEGVCIPEKRGRRIEYRIEDTTFSEPTRS